MDSSAKVALREGKKTKGLEADVSSARIAHGFRPLVFTNYEISNLSCFLTMHQKSTSW